MNNIKHMRSRPPQQNQPNGGINQFRNARVPFILPFQSIQCSIYEISQTVYRWFLTILCAKCGDTESILFCFRLECLRNEHWLFYRSQHSVGTIQTMLVAAQWWQWLRFVVFHRKNHSFFVLLCVRRCRCWCLERLFFEVLLVNVMPNVNWACQRE